MLLCFCGRKCAQELALLSVNWPLVKWVPVPRNLLMTWRTCCIFSSSPPPSCLSPSSFRWPSVWLVVGSAAFSAPGVPVFKLSVLRTEEPLWAKLFLPVSRGSYQSKIKLFLFWRWNPFCYCFPLPCPRWSRVTPLL